MGKRNNINQQLEQGFFFAAVALILYLYYTYMGKKSSFIFFIHLLALFAWPEIAEILFVGPAAPGSMPRKRKEGEKGREKIIKKNLI